MPASTDRHDPWPTLHLLRLLAALSIFSGHWSEPYIPQLWPQGQLAIDVFFMIEGGLSMHLLTGADGQGGIGRRALGRFLHVYPTYALGLVAGLCAFAPLAFAQAESWTVQGWLAALVSGLLLLPTFSTLVHGSVFPLNPPTWAIVLELIGFALLAGTRYWRPRAAMLAIWAGAVAIFGFLALLWHDPNAGWAVTHYWGGLPRMILNFFGGAILFTVQDRLRPVWPRGSPALVCVAFLAMHLPTVRFIGWPLLGIGVPLLVGFGAAAREPAWAQVAGRWAARNALMVYVLGYPVMMLWRMIAASWLDPVSIVAILLCFGAVTATLLLVATIVTGTVSRLARVTAMPELTPA